MTAESYGLQVWHVQPSVMPTAHYHNEIEVIFVEQGQLAYMMNARPLTLTVGDVFVFWASIPHQLTDVLDACTIHIITIPLPIFFNWGLRGDFVADIMRGHPVLLRPESSIIQQIRLYFKQWAHDLKRDTADHRETVFLELHALLHRLSRSYRPERGIAEAVDMQVSPKQVQARRIAHHIATPLHRADHAGGDCGGGRAASELCVVAVCRGLRLFGVGVSDAAPGRPCPALATADGQAGRAGGGGGRVYLGESVLRDLQAVCRCAATTVSGVVTVVGVSGMKR